jgi:hypothetical protein
MTTEQGILQRARLKRGTLLAVGGIQIFDFVSDLAVLVEWYMEKETMLASIGLGFLLAAVIVAALGGSYYIFDPQGPQYPLPVKIIFLILLPLFNLHLIFVGFTMDGKNLSQRTKFFGGKLYATIYESLPISVLTVYYICTSDPLIQKESTALIMLPSLSLSCLSMAYGGTGYITNEAQFTSISAVFRLFLYYVVDISWLLASFWGVFATRQYIVLAYALGMETVGLFCQYAKLFPIMRKWNFIHLFVFCVLQSFPFMLLDTWPKVASVPGIIWSYWPVFVIRRASLLTMCAFSIIAAGGAIWLWVILALVFCLHTLLTVRAWALDEDALKEMKQVIAILCQYFPVLCVFTRRQAEANTVMGIVVSTSEKSALSSLRSIHGRSKSQPCLQALMMHAAWSEEKVKRFVDVAEGVLRTESIKANEQSQRAVENLAAFVTQQIQKFYPNISLHWLLDDPCKVLCSYEPKERDNDLLVANIANLLQQRTACFAAHASGPYESEQQQQPCDEEDSNRLRVGQHVLTIDKDPGSDLNMRALPLVHAANVWLWKSSEGDATQYQMSQPVEECATFISHSWSDWWWIKAIMLRNHLFLMEYDSIILILGFIACTQALPMSFLLRSVVTSGVSFLPLYLVLFIMAVASLRAHLSGWLVPASWGPWPRHVDGDNSIWLDKVCIDQTDADTKQKGIAHLAAYLVRCKTMTIMFGDSYFTRLWTTFELATYCKVHQGHLKDRLSFLSLKWATTWNFLWLLKRVELSQSERRQLATYSCTDANCYMPADRMVVLAFIRQTWGSEENFDEFVRTELPEILRKGKEDFMWRSLRTMNSVLELLF